MRTGRHRATHASPAGPSIYGVVLCALGCHSKMSSSDVRLLPKQFGRARVPTRSIKIWNRPYQPELHTGRVSSCVSEPRRKIKLELSSILPNRRNFSPRLHYHVPYSGSGLGRYPSSIDPLSLHATGVSDETILGTSQQHLLIH